MKKLAFTILVMTNLFSLSNANAAEGKWTEGYGQGNLEYFIDNQGFQLHIDCPTKEGSAEAYSAVTLNQINSGKQIEKFTITVNGLSFDGPFEANSRVGTNNFLALVEGLRKGDAVVKINNKKIIFQKNNSLKILPAYGKKFLCNLD